MNDLNTLFLDARFFICSTIWLSVNPSSNFENFMDSILMDLGTVASMSGSRPSNPHNSDILVWSSGVAELWRRGKVSLGFNASTEIDRVCDPTPWPPTLYDAFLAANESDLQLLRMKEQEDIEDTYLEGVYDTGDEELNTVSLCRYCLASETKRLRTARFASLRARSMNNTQQS